MARILQENADQWQALGVVRVRVFGSVAREQARSDSDVDLLVDFAAIEPPAGLLRLMRVKNLFEVPLERRVDVLTEGGLKPRCGAKSWPTRGRDERGLPTPPRVGVKPLALAALDCWTPWTASRRFTATHTLTTFLADERAQDAVLRNLARLGETTKFIPQRVEDTHPEVPWALLRDLRNLVSHDYFGIDTDWCGTPPVGTVNSGPRYRRWRKGKRIGERQELWPGLSVMMLSCTPAYP